MTSSDYKLLWFNTWVVCWCSLTEILFHPRTSLPTIIATAIQATVYTDTNVHESSSTKFSLKKVMNTTGQCNACHSHKPQPWCCFLGSGNSLLMPLRQLVGTCTCRPLQGIVTSQCDDPHHAPTANFEDISKCRHLHAIVTIQVIVHNMPTQETMSKRHKFWRQ